MDSRPRPRKNKRDQDREITAQPASLNGGQKNTIEGTIKFYLDDIQETERSEPLNPYQAINALKVMISDKPLSSDEYDAFAKQDVLGSITTMKEILAHPCPQNRAGSYPYVDQQEGFSIFHVDSHDCDKLIDKEATMKTRRASHGVFKFDVVYKNGRVVKADDVISLFKTDIDGFIVDWDFVGKEPAGKLSLTNLEDDQTPAVTKNATIDYIELLIKQAIKIQQEKCLAMVQDNAILKHLTPHAIVDLSKVNIEAATLLVMNPIIAKQLNCKHLQEIQSLYPDTAVSDLLKTYIADAPQIDSKSETSLQSSHTIFGKPSNHLMMQAVNVGNLILHGEENDVKKALKLINKMPQLLRFPVIAKDPLGRQVQGTLLQIAAMGGDIDHRDGIVKQKKHGMVEKIISLGYLTKEEIAEQLQCITSDEAQKINEERNKHVLATIQKFCEKLIESTLDEHDTLEDCQARCKPYIDQLEKELQPDTKTVITQGFVFDPKIVYDAMQWFEDNANQRFGGWWNKKSDMFWVNGIGKLQSKLSARDAQMVREGIYYVVKAEINPKRILNNPNLPYFFNSRSHLGQSYYLGCTGDISRGGTWPGIGGPTSNWKSYVKQKQAHCETYKIMTRSEGRLVR